MNRQAIIGIVFVIILIIVGWQVMGMFGGSKTPATTIKPVETAQTPGQMSSATPVNRNPTVTAPTPTTSVPTNPTLAQNNMQGMGMPQANPNFTTDTQIQPASVMPNDLLRQQQQSQNKYITMVNDLQLLRVQRDIAETNQAIAAAELAKVTAEKGISDALTRPSQFATGPMNRQQPGLNNPNQPPIPVVPENTAATYNVVSISMQANHWTALLDYQGKLFSVNVGDVLPIDNSKVVAIGRNGVILRKDNKNRRVSILSSSL